jgi:hypothetical protein
MAYSFSLELKRLHEERERLKAEKYTMQAELRRKYGEGFHLCRHRAKLSLDRGRVSHAYQRLSNWLSRDGVQEVGKYQNCQVKAVPDDLRGQADECIHLQCKPALQPKLQLMKDQKWSALGARREALAEEIMVAQYKAFRELRDFVRRCGPSCADMGRR